MQVTSKPREGRGKHDFVHEAIVDKGHAKRPPVVGSGASDSFRYPNQELVRRWQVGDLRSVCTQAAKTAMQELAGKGNIGAICRIRDAVNAR